MIEAHNLNIRDWSSLQELRCCYLNLNNNTAHKFIVPAFRDLLNNAVSSASNAAAGTFIVVSQRIHYRTEGYKRKLLHI
ncbi:hypothetical protein SUGI_0297860 [Cryptomeria japonica]|nr:hypothetical protein SUGI_0297860 [Cryptomeria japonica]